MNIGMVTRVINIIRSVVSPPSDTAWAPTGIRYTHSGHDEAQGVAGAERAKREEVSRRKLAALRARPSTGAKVATFPDRRAR